jgi:hypothetical protein
MNDDELADQIDSLEGFFREIEHIEQRVTIESIKFQEAEEKNASTEAKNLSLFL